MGRRSVDTSLACLPLSPSERLICDDLRSALGLRSDADLLRVMAIKYCQWQGVPVAASDFALRAHHVPRKGNQRVSERYVSKADHSLRRGTVTRDDLMRHLGVKVDTVKAVLVELKKRGGLVREHNGMSWGYRIETN